jgi:hypothetical protein
MTRCVVRRWLAVIGSALLLSCAEARSVAAAEAAHGSFDVTLDDTFVCELGGGPFASTHSYDDKTFHVPLPPGNNGIDVNFSELGTVTVSGSIDCVFDEGGTFDVTGVNATGDFQWTEMKGEYLDRVPGLSEGDPFPFVGTARCATTRTDEFKTLCDNFEFSFNGLSRALPPAPWYRYYAGDFTFRAVHAVPVDAGPSVEAAVVVDGPGGGVPDLKIAFGNGLLAPGQVRVATLADAHGALPPGMELPVVGTTAIDHGAGPIPFFDGGDERFIEIHSDAALPGSPRIEVCLPVPPPDARGIRPARVLHGEGSGPADRVFVDRTSRRDLASGKICAEVSGFSKFAVATVDVCGNGQRRSDGLLTVAGGLLGKRTVVVDGLTDCAQYPANLPAGLARYCIPDADPDTGECGVTMTLGINRAGCNASGLGSGFVDVASYSGTLKQGSQVQDLGASFGALIAALVNPVEATVGPVTLSLSATKRVTSYRLKHQLTGIVPDSGQLDTDKDVFTIKCLNPGAS